MKDFKNLEVWEKAHNLTLEIYKVTKKFPKEELFSLTAQLRRCCASIPANIAEGCGRSGDAEFGRFLQISLGSTTELEYHLILARDLQFLDDSDYPVLNDRVTEVRKMLIALIKKIKQ